MNHPFNNSIILNWIFKDCYYEDEFPDGVVTMGSGPFEEQEFDSFLEDLGIKVYEDNPNNPILIIGHEDWQEQELESKIHSRQGKDLFLYSQEMFISMLMNGNDPFQESEDFLLLFAEGHPGLDYAKEFGFDWPNTHVGNIKDSLEQPLLNIPETGILKYYGYNVGINGLRAEKRQAVLRKVFEQALPIINSQEYMDSWGAPHSAKRLKKLADSIATFSRNAQRRTTPAMRKAIQDWENDLIWLKRNYYRKVYKFKWPDTHVG